MLDPALAVKGDLLGLHQYNELGELTVPHSDADARDPEGERLRHLTSMLQGKNQ